MSLVAFIKMLPPRLKWLLVMSISLPEIIWISVPALKVMLDLVSAASSAIEEIDLEREVDKLLVVIDGRLLLVMEMLLVALSNVVWVELRMEFFKVMLFPANNAKLLLETIEPLSLFKSSPTLSIISPQENIVEPLAMLAGELLLPVLLATLPNNLSTVASDK